MIQIKNNIIPFKGYKAITLWPFIFIRKDCIFDEVDLNHEKIHGKQQLEMLLVLFYIWYVVEYLIRLIYHGGNNHKAYNNISFEKEAYINEENLHYLRDRKLFSWFKYIIY